ncbi:6-phosphogluconolactonase [Sphingomonas rhizophila]|uniref:6-phosphogluconolactonase n=1 Tax=Sphingomonas rhizophila TaxID=2071607 RepID=A0A7G9SBY2_9SPHN|nr:6-phosphogluconolactonase [Sphingomonas rhizophila]QNN65357.1 6-phosphogluconolactonase [Sphingomonas rhizophila]
MIEAEFWDYDSVDEMADAVAGDIGFIVESAIEARGNALLALPGGKTPVPIYQRLAKAELPWKRVTIIPGDERLVPMDNELSNVRALAKTFLPVGARVIPVTGDIADVKLAGNSADARLQDLPWPPDVVLLGMGTDGHTASIFPGADLEDALNAPKARRMVGVTPDPLPPEAPVGRVTLTRSAILSARTLLIAITGQEKRDLLEQAIEDGHSSKLPIGRVLAEAEQPIDIHWAP